MTSNFLIQPTRYFLEGYQYNSLDSFFPHKLSSNSLNLTKQNLVPLTQFALGRIIEYYMQKPRWLPSKSFWVPPLLAQFIAASIIDLQIQHCSGWPSEPRGFLALCEKLLLLFQAQELLTLLCLIFLRTKLYLMLVYHFLNSASLMCSIDCKLL